MSITVALVGNPNCGKTTIFNELTKSKQKVGNWPGVTVECKSGEFSLGGKEVKVIDLPGIYQLSYSNHQQAVDEKIACEFILSQQADVIVNIIDAAHLERHLYLTLQLLSLKIPLILAINMMDVAKRRKIELHLNKLQSILGCTVVGLVANKGNGVQELKQSIIKNSQTASVPTVEMPSVISNSVNQLEIEITQQHPNLAHSAYWLAEQVLQDPERIQMLTPSIRQNAAKMKLDIERELEEELDILYADNLYSNAHQMSQQIIVIQEERKTYSEKIDKYVLNRWLGIPIFLTVMYIMFLFAINLGGAFQDFFDIASETLFVKSIENILTYLHAPIWLIAVLAAGLGKGINTTISFIPVIGAMFFFLALLEGSGYMARASVVIDRLMRVIGLPGKSFVPMIVGFGCNVPAILATRTLETERDRTLTILMSPFMSCGARLAIFAVFTAAFFPSGGQNVVFALYLIGILAAISTGFILRKTLLKGPITPLVLELPAYHMPSFNNLVNLTWYRLKSFIFRAGKLIVPICMLIGVLNAVNLDGTLNRNISSSQSLLSVVGQQVTPILSPMGIDANNWPATVGLITGVLAKEVVIATLNTLYSQSSSIKLQEQTQNNKLLSNLQSGLKAALVSIPQNLIALKNSFANPIAASTPQNEMNGQVYGIMYQRFGGKVAAFAYLLFVLLYFPCISATAVMTKELNKGWSLFSVAWSTIIAYAVATIFYQLVTFHLHPVYSASWIFSLITLVTLIILIMKKMGSAFCEVRESKLCC